MFCINVNKSSEDYPTITENEVKETGKMITSFDEALTKFEIDRKKVRRSEKEKGAEEIGTSPTRPTLCTLKHIFYERPSTLMLIDKERQKEKSKNILYGFKDT